MVVARLNRYLPVNGHVVIDCSLLTVVDLVVLALARSSGRDRLQYSDRCWPRLDCSRHDRLRLRPLSVSVRAFASISSSGGSPGPLAEAIPLTTLVTACGHFCPLTACGQWREDGEPGMSNRRVWRRLLSPRLLLSLVRLLVSPLFVRHAVAAFLPAVLDLARSFLRPGRICFPGSGCGLGGRDCSCIWRVGSAVPFSFRCRSSHW